MHPAHYDAYLRKCAAAVANSEKGSQIEIHPHVIKCIENAIIKYHIKERLPFHKMDSQFFNDLINCKHFLDHSISEYH